MFWLLVHVLLYGTSGFRDETLSHYAAPGAVYRLTELDGAAPQAAVTVTFPRMWLIAWHTRCGDYSAKIMVPYPWFELGKTRVLASRCAESPEDERLRAALDRMTLAEAQGGVLILSNTDGEGIEFRAQP